MLVWIVQLLIYYLIYRGVFMKKSLNVKIKIVNRGVIEVEALSIENKDRFLIIKTTDNKTIILPLYNLEYILY